MTSLYKATRYLKVGLLGKVQFRSVRCGLHNGVDFKDAKPFNEIPGPKGIYNLPLIGAMLHFKPFTDATMDTIYHLYDRVMDKHGTLVRIRLGQSVVLVEDPSDIDVVRKSEGKYPERIIFPLNLMFCEKTGAAKSLGELQGEEWHNFRSPLNARLMRAKAARHYLPVQNEVADDLIARMNRPFSAEEIMEIFYRYACESISVVAFNKRLGYLDPDIEVHPEKLEALADIRTMLRLLNKSLQMPAFVVKYFPLKLKRDFFAAGSRLLRYTTDYYRKTIEDIDRHNNEGSLGRDGDSVMLSLLMSDKLSPVEMAAVAYALFTAGTDSTARGLQMVLYNLARNPDKQEKLYDEIKNAVGPYGPLTEEALDSMKYLAACVKESFRLIYPTSSGTQRYLAVDIVLQGYRIPAGTSIMLMNQRAVKNPKYFPDPDSYIPERWLRDEDGKRETPIPSSAFLPFGFGPRQCIGKRFAEQEIYLAVTKVLQNFQISLEPDQKEIEVEYSPFAGPKDTIHFVITERGNIPIATTN